MTRISPSHRFMAALAGYALAIPYVAALVAVMVHEKPAELPKWLPLALRQGLNSIGPDNAFLAGVMWALIIWVLLAIASMLLK